MDRLNEISIQAFGVRALQESDVAKRLGITAQQSEQVQKVQTESSDQIRSQVPTLSPSDDRDQQREKMLKLRKAADDKVLSLLSAVQKKKFEQPQRDDAVKHFRSQIRLHAGIFRVARLSESCRNDTECRATLKNGRIPRRKMLHSVARWGYLAVDQTVSQVVGLGCHSIAPSVLRTNYATTQIPSHFKKFFLPW
jgi:hypothetical protein